MAKDDGDLIRKATRPVIIIMLNFFSLLIISLGLFGDLISAGPWLEWAEKFFWATLAIDIEWVLERPFIKIFSNLDISRKS